AGLAACVNIIPGMISLYTWQGRRQRDQEVVMIVKTRVHLVDRATEEIRRSHPYDTPAIVALPVAGGSAAFLDWIMAETDDARASGGQG
ncbi:MAG: divalent-cation tolerance protein CutA, partial [Pseudorhodoplanes sp.]